MPSGAEQVLMLMEKGSSSDPPATPASLDPALDKPRAAPASAGGSEHRKSSKPIMEKRRRARINESLAQLKTLILDALKKDSSRHSKLEKADILEMTVKHLRSLQRTQMAAAVLNADPTVLGKYRAGFNECVNEVTRFLSTCEGVTAEVRTRLLAHLGSCMSQINTMNFSAPPPAPGPSFGQALVQIPAGPAAPAAAPVPGSVAPCKPSGNPAAPGETPKVYGGFQLVPASDGQFAFLIPNAAFAPHGNAVIPLYANAGVGSGGLLPTTAAVSPGSVVQSLPADSVWRPW